MNADILCIEVWPYTVTFQERFLDNIIIDKDSLYANSYFVGCDRHVNNTFLEYSVTGNQWIRFRVTSK